MVTVPLACFLDAHRRTVVFAISQWLSLDPPRGLVEMFDFSPKTGLSGSSIQILRNIIRFIINHSSLNFATYSTGNYWYLGHSYDTWAGLGSNTFYQIQIQIHFFRSFKYKYKYKYTGKNLIKYKYKYSPSNTNTHQIQIQIHTEAETKLLPFYRWHIQIHCIARRLFYLFKFHWKLFPLFH